MNDFAREKLVELVRTQGPALVQDARRLRGLLKDLCPHDKKEVHVLVSAVEERVPQDLAATPDGLPWEGVSARLVQRLVDGLGMGAEAARWAVDSWGLALGKGTGGNQPPKRIPPVSVPKGITAANHVRSPPPDSARPGYSLRVVMAIFLIGIFLGVITVFVVKNPPTRRSRAKPEDTRKKDTLDRKGEVDSPEGNLEELIAILQEIAELINRMEDSPNGKLALADLEKKVEEANAVVEQLDSIQLTEASWKRLEENYQAVRKAGDWFHNPASAEFSKQLDKILAKLKKVGEEPKED
jgi:hypothetical protein